MKNYKQHIIFLSIIAVLLVTLYFLAQIILPFFIGLVAAYYFNRIIVKLRKYIPNRNLATTLVITVSIAIFALSIGLFGKHVVHDFKRISNAFKTYAETNSEDIDATRNQVKSYIEKIYSQVEIEQQLNAQADTSNSPKLDSETLKEGFAAITSFMGSSEDAKESSGHDLNWFLIFIYSFGYFFCIVYTYEYFEQKFKKYFSVRKNRPKYLDGLLLDFKNIFLTYFRQRTKIVLICMAIFMTTFIIMGVPGAILLGLVGGLLCYIPHFHYLTLLPLSLCCWVLSIELDANFFLFYGIIIGIFIVVSVLEELVFFPKIMKGVSSMNPAIMMLSYILWSYIFGATTGILIALPLSTLLLLYMDKILLYLRDEYQTEEN
ncbi:MAG: putative PurR-regulated permease PerM [Crocinitomicaceae bacterium]|jgi:predicted PurR-regulated permease PerM